MPKKEVTSKNYRENYLKYSDYYINYSKNHWPEYYKKNKAKIKAQRKRFYLENRERILARDHLYNMSNRVKKRQYNISYRAKNRKKLLAKDQLYYRMHITERKKYKELNSARISLRAKAYNSNLKKAVLANYAISTVPKCAMCKEERLRLLTLDHIKNNGAKKLRELHKKGGIGFYLWPRKNNYPSGYQVLCYNCNWSKRYNDKETMRSMQSKRIKIELFSHYLSDGKLECLLCHENNFNLLTLDHINGNGNLERQRLGLKGTDYYSYLIKKNYPSGFRILCLNCNVLEYEAKQKITKQW